MKETISNNLGIPYVKHEGLYICNSGVAFTDSEVKEHGSDSAWFRKEHERRLSEGNLYDYRKAKEGVAVMSDRKTFMVMFIIVSLTLTSFASMYISTLQTAQYLFDYMNVATSWILSGIITVYCSVAFEVVIMFWKDRKKALATVFALLWLLVCSFSIFTAVSVFYDRFNFNTIEDIRENSRDTSYEYELEALKVQEQTLRDDIQFLKDEIEYRRMRDYATNSRMLELEEVQTQLQENLEAQNALVREHSVTMSAKDNTVVEKESFTNFIGRTYGVDGGVLNFIISTLPAVFVNLIAPFTLCIVTTLTERNKEDESEGN